MDTFLLSGIFFVFFPFKCFFMEFDLMSVLVTIQKQFKIWNNF